MAACGHQRQANPPAHPPACVSTSGKVGAVCGAPAPTWPSECHSFGASHHGSATASPLRGSLLGMAIVAGYHDLRRQIDSLVAENEELKQLIQLLRENHELKYVLRNRFSESSSSSSSLLPDNEPTRIEAKALRSLQNSPGRIPPRFGPHHAVPRQPSPNLAIQPPPPPPPRTRGPVALGQPPSALKMAMQLPEDMSQPYRFRPMPPTSNPANLTFGTNSSPGIRGFCFECPYPWHPHLPPFLPASQGSDPNISSLQSGTFSSADWSVANSQVTSAALSRSPPGQAAAGPMVATGPQVANIFDFSPQNIPSQVAMLGAGAVPALPWAGTSFFPANPLPAGPAGPILRTVPQAQSNLQPIILRNPEPFVLQPPPPGRMAQGMPFFPAVPFAQPTQAPMGPQRPPDVRPKERRAPPKPDAETVMKAAEAKRKDTSSQERVLGEISFQLDRRILANIFPNRTRLYGYTVQNVPEKVAQGGNDPFQKLSPEESAAILERYNSVMARLAPLGYDPNVHPRLMETIVNNFGILRDRPEGTEEDFSDTAYLRNLIKDNAPPDMRNTCMLLLDCLQMLSQEDGKPLFIW